MGIRESNRLTDGYLSLESGIESGMPSALLPLNQCAWAVNTTFRDAWPKPRPGWVKREIDFASSEAVRTGIQDGYFQGAGTYIADSGEAYLALSVSGRIFLIDIQAGFLASEITIPGDANMVNRPHAWFQQAERWLIVQNGLNPPFLYNGSGSRRAGDSEVPVGGPMAYGKGRLWVARDSLYYGGDIVWGDQVYGRDTVIRFTENDFLAEGGAFAVPDGPVTGMAFAANLDTSLGDGDLLVSTTKTIYAFNAPINRQEWKQTQYPIQRYAAIRFGALSHESMVLFNGDVFYRAPDGVRTLMYARRDFSEWGQTPVSRAAHRAFKFDTFPLLAQASGVNFDNRALFTVQPQQDNAHGVYHRGLASLDFHRVSGLGAKLPPAWEGVWTGINILRILTIDIGADRRCFAFTLSNAGQIQLFELTRDRWFDFDGNDDVPIQWILETRGMAFGIPNTSKRLTGAIQWFDRIRGEVSVVAKYRADESECWQCWAKWTTCVKYRVCDTTTSCIEYPYSAVLPTTVYRSQTRPNMGLTQPLDIPEIQTGGFTRDGFEFQIRFEISGQLRFKRLNLFAYEIETDGLWGDIRNTECIAVDALCSPDGSDVGCCDPNECPAGAEPPPPGEDELFSILGSMQLRTLTGFEDLEMQFLGFLNVPHDGQGGWFVFRDSATNDDDGVDWIKPNTVNSSSPGRWERTTNP